MPFHALEILYLNDLELPKDGIRVDVLFYHVGPKVATNARRIFREPTCIKFSFLDIAVQVFKLIWAQYFLSVYQEYQQSLKEICIEISSEIYCSCT